jgi:hypothetical protein
VSVAAGPAPGTRGLGWQVLLGDWTPIVRDWSDVVRIAYLAGAGYAFADGADGHGVRLLVTFVAALAPRLLNTPRPFDLFFTATIGLQAWGNLAGLFHNGDPFDRVDHAMSTLGLAPLFYLWFVRLGLLRHTDERRPRSQHVGLVVIGMCIGLSVGALYEIYEYVAVHDFGAANFVSESDTVMDLVMDAVGSFVGSCLLLAWVVWGWGTERRVTRPVTFSVGQARTTVRR